MANNNSVGTSEKLCVHNDSHHWMFFLLTSTNNHRYRDVPEKINWSRAAGKGQRFYSRGPVHVGVAARKN